MEKNNYRNKNSINENIIMNDDVLKINYNNDKLENKSKLRKRAINKILMKKAVIFVEEITNEKLNELEKLDYDKQFEIIKSQLESKNESNIIKILSYIIKNICPFPAENKNKRKMLNENIINNVLNVFYSTNNKDIFSLCSSILSNFCTDYILFSIDMINNDFGIKKVYNELQNKYFNNPYIISNCLNCYKEGLAHLSEQINTRDINDNINENAKDISYNSKRSLCHLVNWILYNKELYFSLPQEGMQSFFKLLELLIKSASVPSDYKMEFDLNYSNNNMINDHFANLVLYLLSIPLKDLEYDTCDYYLSLLVLITKNENYKSYLTKKYNNICIFDVIKKLFGYIYLDNNSTDEDRLNNPNLDSLFISYCFEIMTNLIIETVNHKDIMDLIYKIFRNYRGTVSKSEEVPLTIMGFFLKLSENLNIKEVYNFIFDPKKTIINDCIKFYVRNNKCYVLVMQFLINIFEFKNFNEIEKVNINDVIKCIINGLDIQDREVNNKSVNCLGKMIEININREYNIDLILKYEENQVVEKLNLLILNNKNNNKMEEDNIEELLKYIENKIKEEEKINII